MSSSEGRRIPESTDASPVSLRTHDHSLGTPREVASSELLRDADRLFIRHEGQCYTLRVTSSKKLILNK
ncbi:Hemin uptake protein hemP [Thioalkalivibrio sp. K90mix]|uniref:hemin uptake protein HemP n=1 Tax=Thioalkalivibrio sp. (strain K90mix) TaxID=396595 RepID=UPI000195A9FA|nr:hemin uptake protein HemP [Thioalkalivibrio sp. K90mix]ADC70959.1 Hemin uptake protein hemP [Thioalkalivibrio sp. K90mix]